VTLKWTTTKAFGCWTSFRLWKLRGQAHCRRPYLARPALEPRRMVPRRPKISTTRLSCAHGKAISVLRGANEILLPALMFLQFGRLSTDCSEWPARRNRKMMPRTTKATSPPLWIRETRFGKRKALWSGALTRKIRNSRRRRPSNLLGDAGTATRTRSPKRSKTILRICGSRTVYSMRYASTQGNADDHCRRG
jgi:hypothetical protein